MLNRRQIAHEPLATPQQVLRFVRDAQDSGLQAVLVVLTGTSNGGPRSPGALMAVVDTGARAGSLSSGCVETAIGAEALNALADGKSRLVRFGNGSKYIDMRLPCGAGMDLLFIPRPDATALRQAIASLDDRRPVTLGFAADGFIACSEVEPSPSGASETFAARYTPGLRVIVAGHGAEADALVRQALAFGATVELLTPDEDLLESAIRDGVSARLLEQVGQPPQIDADPWTAVAIMFHDHDWEPTLIEASLRSAAFWIGAMGSSRTAERRRSLLAERGMSPEQIGRVRGPIGTIPSARDPSTLALSTLAEIVSAFAGARA